MDMPKYRKSVLAVLLCSICIGGALIYGIREQRIRQLTPSLDKEFAAMEDRRRHQEDALLPVGATVPDFVLETATGGSLSLKELRRGHKAILLHFWFYGCGPCQEELPLLIAFHTTFQSSGLAVVALNNGDGESTLRQWVLDNRVRFPVVMAENPPSAGKKNTLRSYRVSAYPTDYLIDSEGRVLWRGVGGAEEATLRAAFVQAGISQARSLPLIRP